MTAEGVLGIVAGARASSISLIGWALGSVIEGLASIIVIWRFTGSRTLSETSEGRAQRGVAISFFLLAPYLFIEGTHDLVTGHASHASALGLAITISSVFVMPLLGAIKQRLGRTLDSEATAGEGLQNLMCALQAAAVVIGLVLTRAFGWHWVDPAVALVLAAWAIREGCAAWQGRDDCC